MEEALDRIDAMVQGRKPAYVVTPNLDHIVTIERDAYFREAYAHADLILADGKPLLWIAKARKTPIREKISGSDLFPRLAELAANKGYTMFFLGAGEGIAAQAAEKLKQQYPGLRIAGCYAPPIGFEQDRSAVHEIIQRVRSRRSFCIGIINRWKYRYPLGLVRASTSSQVTASVPHDGCPNMVLNGCTGHCRNQSVWQDVI